MKSSVGGATWLRDLLVRADSITSLVASRHAAELPEDVKKELLAVSWECRNLADQMAGRDQLAVLLASSWWPGRFLGDLSTADWRRVYAVLDEGGQGAS